LLFPNPSELHPVIRVIAKKDVAKRAGIRMDDIEGS